jgi:hypothetical protein
LEQFGQSAEVVIHRNRRDLRGLGDSSSLDLGRTLFGEQRGGRCNQPLDGLFGCQS